MPIMQVHYLKPALDDARKAALAERLTDIMIQMEGGADTEGGRAFASVLFSPYETGDWWVGGRRDDRFVAPPGRFLVHVSIPEGYMNAAHKSDVQSWVTAAILDVMGPAPAPTVGRSIQVIIDEVTEGNWAAKGQTISLSSIAETVGLNKGGERFDWVRAYFDAKARQYTAAGYPKDTGGLLQRQPAAIDESQRGVHEKTN